MCKYFICFTPLCFAYWICGYTCSSICENPATHACVSQGWVCINLFPLPFFFLFFFFLKQYFSLNLELADSAGLAAQWCLAILLSVPSATEPQIPNLGITLTLNLAFQVGSEHLHSGLLVQIAKTHRESMVNPECLVPGPKPHPDPHLLFCLIAFCDLLAFV